MRVNTSQNKQNFGYSFFVSATKNPLIKNPEASIRASINQSTDALNAIIRTCSDRKIPCIVAEFTSESAVVPKNGRALPMTIDDIPENLAFHSVLTGKEAVDFQKNYCIGDSYLPSQMKIPKGNVISAGKILELVSSRAFASLAESSTQLPKTRFNRLKEFVLSLLPKQESYRQPSTGVLLPQKN